MKIVLGKICHYLILVMVLFVFQMDLLILLYIWNPLTTRHFKKLPGPKKQSVCQRVSLGFGFDCISNDYRLFRFLIQLEPSSNIIRFLINGLLNRVS